MLAYDCCKQKKPVDALQSVVPHAQSMEFVSLPSIIVQDESCALTPCDIDEKLKHKSIRMVVILDIIQVGKMKTIRSFTCSPSFNLNFC